MVSVLQYCVCLFLFCQQRVLSQGGKREKEELVCVDPIENWNAGTGMGRKMSSKVAPGAAGWGCHSCFQPHALC